MPKKSSFITEIFYSCRFYPQTFVGYFSAFKNLEVPLNNFLLQQHKQVSFDPCLQEHCVEIISRSLHLLSYFIFIEILETSPFLLNSSLRSMSTPQCCLHKNIFSKIPTDVSLEFFSLLNLSDIQMSMSD